MCQAPCWMGHINRSVENQIKEKKSFGFALKYLLVQNFNTDLLIISLIRFLLSILSIVEMYRN
jgi:hypothetical protein